MQEVVSMSADTPPDHEGTEPAAPHPVAPTVPLKGRRVKSFDTMTADEWKALEARGRSKAWYIELEQWMQRLVEAKKHNGGDLRGTGLRNQAAEALKVSVWTIDRKLQAYEAHPHIDALLEHDTGPMPSTSLTEEQQGVVLYVLKNPRTELRINHDIIRIPTRPDATFIHRHIFPRVFPNAAISLQKIKRYIKRMRESSPETDLVIKLAQYGADVIRNNYMPTPGNDAERPGQRVLIDARPLPIYIKHNGIVCTVAILLMIDDFSRFPIRARLVPRKILDWNELPKRADITADDVAVLIASAIWFDDFCFEELYTDNASSNKAVGKPLDEIGTTADELIADITGGGDTFIHFVKSIPGRPRARGKVEKALGLLNKAIDGHPGFVANERDWKCLQEAQNHPELYSLEQLEALLNTHLEDLRDQSFGNRKQTRRQLWTSKGKRPALPIRQLVHVMPKERKAEKQVAIDNYKIRFLEEYHEDYFEPRLETEEDWWLWTLAIVRKDRIPLRAIKLDDEQWYVEGCLDPDNPRTSWRRLVLKRSQRIKKDWRNQMIGHSIKRLKEMDAGLATQLEGIVQELLQDNEADVDAGAARADSQESGSPDTGAPSSGNQSASTVPRTISTRTRPATPPPPPQPSGDTFDDIDFDELL
jgi:hypothetical protein